MQSLIDAAAAGAAVSRGSLKGTASAAVGFGCKWMKGSLMGHARAQSQTQTRTAVTHPVGMGLDDQQKCQSSRSSSHFRFRFHCQSCSGDGAGSCSALGAAWRLDRGLEDAATACTAKAMGCCSPPTLCAYAAVLLASPFLPCRATSSCFCRALVGPPPGQSRGAG